MILNVRFLLTVVLLLWGNASSTPVFASSLQWHFERGRHPLSHQDVCKMVSQSYHFDDEERTRVQLAIVDQSLFAVTDANIDASYEKTGIKIDWRKPIPFSKVVNKQVVVFEDLLRDHKNPLIYGKSMVLSLGFWPTWPKLEVNKVKIGLRGFKKSFKQYQQCLNNL